MRKQAIDMAIQRLLPGFSPIFFLLFVLGIATAAAHSPNLDTQRQYYTAAREALGAGDLKTWQRLRQQLQHYPLLPYLEYQEIVQSLDDYPYAKVDRFLDRHGHSYAGELMLRRWLDQLAAARRWQEYRSYYLPIPGLPRYQCRYLWSRYKTGDPEALAGAGQLWNVATSQPNECEPLFEQWQAAGFLDTDLLWDRHRKTLLKNQQGLARYLRKKMTDDRTLELAHKFRRTLNNPALLANRSNYPGKHPYMADIVFYSLQRYAREEPTAALTLWQRYQQQFAFTENQRHSFYFRLAKKFAFLEDQQAVLTVIDQLADAHKTQVIEIVLRSALRQQQWQQVLDWLALLPPEALTAKRWRYWEARATQAMLMPREKYRSIFAELAKTRSFYGFLSADLLNEEYNLQDISTKVNSATIAKVAEIPGLKRARELHYFNELHYARQEWARATSGFSVEQHRAAARLADQWGWYRKSIESMAAAKTWDDLHIRFPVAYETIIRRQARQTNLPATLIFAIARQESAWGVDARSSAGAVGLMQLLPTTAKGTASKAGLRHSKPDLLHPGHNIALGSHYISELMSLYDNNRVPAIAAYNAGPTRVNRWLEKSDRQLPHDIWIETIPFGETRSYVQNVLSYAVVYGYRTEEKIPLLTRREVNSRL